MRPEHRFATTLALVPLLALLCGCPDPNVYGTPRTLAPGDVSVQAGMSGFIGAANGTAEVISGVPSIGVRVGVADRVDLGVRLADLTSLTSDLKYNFLRGRFDMAVDPGVQAYYFASGAPPPLGALQFHLPLLLGLNFDEEYTLVLTPGFIATVTTEDPWITRATLAQAAAFAPGLGARLGLGLNIRSSDRFTWQPEITAWHEFNDVESWVCVFGIGVSVGAQPDYSDLAPAR